MELFAMLRKDHQKVLQMFDRFASLKGHPEKNKKEMEKLFSELQREIKMHMEGEEKYLYPALRDAQETHENIMESFEEHHVVKVLLREMDRIQLSDKWLAKLMVMKENVRHHLQEEEEELFEKAQKILDKDQIKEIGEQISRMRH